MGKRNKGNEQAERWKQKSGPLRVGERCCFPPRPAEAPRRMERDGYPETAQSETAQTETAQNQEVN